MKRLMFMLAVVSLFATGLHAQVAEGDQHWAARAEGQQGGRAKATHIDAAIAAYQRAVAANRNDLEARWKLLRAIRFKGAYVAASNDDKRRVFGEGKSAGEQAIAAVTAQLSGKGVTNIEKANEKAVADAARNVPGAADVFFWDAVNWGEWAVAYGKMAAVREGAADRIRREATIAMLIDPKLDGGGPARVLGRLHDQTPHVPFITGWASNREAVRFLNDSVKTDPSNKITRVFLAEAMVDNDSGSKRQAIEVLRQVVNSPNDPRYEVESVTAQNDARTLLHSWGVK